MNHLFAIIGSWGFGDTPKGLTVFRYNKETAELTDPVRYDETVSAGHQCYDAKRRILYVADEVVNHPGELGGGGFVRAYKCEEGTGKLIFLNEVCVLMTKPAYIALDPSGNYLLAACHSGRTFVTKVIHDAKGNWSTSVLFEDAGVTLVRINTDGSLGEVCDVAVHVGLTKNIRQIHSHPHSIVGSPDGRIYFACDKGLDRIYSYRINKEAGKLIPLTVTEMEYATAPRYSAFHPTLPVWYENNETGNKLYAFKYDSESGALQKLSVITLGEVDGTPDVSSSDVIVHPNGRTLYAAVRALSTIVICDIDKNGAISYKSVVNSVYPIRGFCVSPDGNYMLAACERKDLVKVFAIDADGLLTDTGREYLATAAANVQIIET